MCHRWHVLCVEIVMKIAIPVFQNRVSPVFDWSSRILVIETDGRLEIGREEHGLAGASLKDRADRLMEMKVDSLLCGGISEAMLALLIARGINVIPWVAGDTEEVFSAFLEGRVPGNGFMMPGRCGWRRGRGFGGEAPRGRCRRRGSGPDGKTKRRKDLS